MKEVRGFLVLGLRNAGGAGLGRGFEGSEAKARGTGSARGSGRRRVISPMPKIKDVLKSKSKNVSCT
jgi:hypothetical protein